MVYTDTICLPVLNVTVYVLVSITLVSSLLVLSEHFTYYCITIVILCDSPISAAVMPEFPPGDQ